MSSRTTGLHYHSIILNGFQLYVHNDKCNLYRYPDVHGDTEFTQPKYQQL
jgi:hypothetical protein